MQTQNGIELNLKESKYKYEYGDYVYYFSSKFYKEKFEKNVGEFIIYESLKLKNKYQLHIDFSLFLAVAYYRRVEKRGFRIIHKTKGFLISELTVFNSEMIG